MSRRQELKRRLAEKQAERRRRRWTLLALLVLVILLALLCQCECVVEPPPVVEAPADPVPGEAVEPEPVVVEGPPPPPMKRIDRPALETEPVPVLPWLDAFRMQVSARSPRLADCFVGAERPGRLRWTAAVEPGRGLVSQQQVEPVLVQDALTREQQDCVVAVLADPPYRLEVGDGPTTPSRVSMVIEF